MQYNQQSAATRLALNSFLVCLLSCATFVHLRRTANPFVISYELHNEIPSVAFMCVYISTISSSCCSSSTFKRAELAHETSAEIQIVKFKVFNEIAIRLKQVISDRWPSKCNIERPDAGTKEYL